MAGCWRRLWSWLKTPVPTCTGEMVTLGWTGTSQDVLEHTRPCPVHDFKPITDGSPYPCVTCGGPCDDPRHADLAEWSVSEGGSLAYGERVFVGEKVPPFDLVTLAQWAIPTYRGVYEQRQISTTLLVRRTEWGWNIEIGPSDD